MRRFVTLALILVFSIPVGLSISGCSKGGGPDYCNGGSSGEQTGQITNIDLEPRLYGISLNYGSIAQVGAPAATDCKGESVGVVRYTYGTTNINTADISPSGSICAGSWNRNTPGGVADYTTCSPPANVSPSFVTTQPTVTVPHAIATLTLPSIYASVNGSLGISVGGGTAATGTITNTVGPAGFVAAFNNPLLLPFNSANIVASFSGNVITLTGPTGLANTFTFTDTNLVYSDAPYFTTPTAPTATTGASTTLTFLDATANINGTVDISLAGSALPAATISGTSGPLSFATAFSNAFSSKGISAQAAGNVVTITGPIGTANTLSFTGTSLSYGSDAAAAYITATAGGAVSNAVPIYVHPTVSSVSLTPQTGCFSQGITMPLTASVFSAGSTDITAITGPLNFIPQDSTVVSINSTTVPPIATAGLPGSTIISASTSNASSAAGIFYTCPPASITLSVPNSSTPNSIMLNLNTPQALNAAVVDSKGAIITGLNLEYISTSPRTVAASSTGIISANYPGAGTITAVCQPAQCNPSPLNQMGQQGNGLPVTSNPISVTTPGTVNTVLYMASPNSQYFTSIDFSTGQVGSPVRLPYVPNSMLSDQLGQALYFGSPSELMQVSMASNTVTKEDASVKGSVVGVSNDGGLVVMSDAVHNLIYIYFTSNGSNLSFGGTATHAAFTPDDQSIYITGSDSLGDNFFVYSTFDGWHPYKLANAPTDAAVTVPAIGAYLAGTVTTARSYCPLGVPPTDFYPSAGSQATPTDRIAATNNSLHILGASATTKLLADLNLTLPSSAGPSNPGACPSGTGFTFSTVPYTVALGVNPATITGVIPDADSSVAFVTYTSTGTSAVLPEYKPVASGLGTMTPVALTGSATAPVSGIFSPDGLTFYTGTSGDNLIHLITLSSGVWSDTKTITPALPVCAVEDATGNCTTLGTGFATPALLADKPRPTT